MNDNSAKASIYNPVSYSQNNSVKANVSKTQGNINSTDTDLTIGGNGTVYGYRIQASASGSVKAIYFHLNSPSSGNTLYVALYNGTSTTVGTIISSWSKATVGTSNQWVVIPVTGVNITSGNYYWLVGNNDVGATFHGRTVGGTRSAEWTDVTPGSWTSPPTGVAYTNGEDLDAFFTFDELNTYSQANSAKASIVTTVSKNNSSEANILAIGQQADYSKANIYVTDTTQNNNVKANIITTYYTGATYDWKLTTDTNNQNRGYIT